MSETNSSALKVHWALKRADLYPSRRIRGRHGLRGYWSVGYRIERERSGVTVWHECGPRTTGLDTNQEIARRHSQYAEILRAAGYTVRHDGGCGLVTVQA